MKFFKKLISKAPEGLFSVDKDRKVRKKDDLIAELKSFAENETYSLGQYYLKVVEKLESGEFSLEYVTIMVGEIKLYNHAVFHLALSMQTELVKEYLKCEPPAAPQDLFYSRLPNTLIAETLWQELNNSPALDRFAFANLAMAMNADQTPVHPISYRDISVSTANIAALGRIHDLATNYSVHDVSAAAVNLLDRIRTEAENGIKNRNGHY